MEKPDKSGLREAFLKKRDALTAVERARDSAIIRHRVLTGNAWTDAHSILIYASFRSEVETTKLIMEALNQKKRILMPVLNSDGETVGVSELRAIGDLAPGPKFGIYEPAPALRQLVDPTEVELALVPGVAFDRLGGRLGFGGGYFDRLLRQMPRARKIGLAYSVQISKSPLPALPHDIRVEQVITEKEVIVVDSGTRV